MHRFILILSVLGLLILTSCAGPGGITVENSNGKAIGEIQLQGAQTATIINTRGDVRGKVRGTVIRDDSGKHVGTVVEQNGHVVIEDGNDNPVGTLANGIECYGKGKEVLGRITAKVDSSAAAAACLLFFLQ